MQATNSMGGSSVDDQPVIVRLSNLFLINESIIRVLLCCGLLYTMFVLNGFTRVVDESQWHLYSFPYSEEQLPVLDTALICGFTFLFVCAMSYSLNKYLFKENNRYIKLDLLFLVLGFSLCVMSTLLLVEIIKNMVGRLRPSFLEYCVGIKDDARGSWDNIPKYSVDDYIIYNDKRDYDFQCNLCEGDDCKLWSNGNAVATEEEELYRSLVLEKCNAITGKYFRFPSVPDCARIFSYTEEKVNLWNKLKGEDEDGDKYMKEAVLFPRDEHHLADMRKSFPSGHSATTFASFLYMGLYAGWFFSIRQGYWRNTLWFTLMVMFLAFPICCAITRSMDYRHHATDILVGSLIGTAMGIVSFGMYYNLSEVAGAPLSDVLLKYVAQPGNFTHPTWGVEFEGESKEEDDSYYTEDEDHHEHEVRGSVTSSEDSNNGYYLPSLTFNNPQ